MKLLIVDDEIRAVQALVKRVNWQEYDFEPPLAAYSMAQAQGVFQQQEIYLMLCDIEMPQGVRIGTVRVGEDVLPADGVHFCDVP